MPALTTNVECTADDLNIIRENTTGRGKENTVQSGAHKLLERVNKYYSQLWDHYPLVVPVYSSVQLAPLGHTVPISVQAVLSGEVRISIPGAVARIMLIRAHPEPRGFLTEDEILSAAGLAHSGICDWVDISRDYAWADHSTRERCQRQHRDK